ncbi:MAG: hypothetical protein IKJ43_04045 [Bacilli bacterium]|nr:hypothetical protein [Bacilli bacterium]
MEYKGIDVSKYQGDIDFSKVSKNVDFVIIRIGYGMYESQKDPKFEANYEGFRNLNVPVGVYHYSYARSIDEAKREADVVIKWLNGRNLNLPVYFDIEDKSQVNLGKNVLTSMCEAFCNKIEKAGYWAGIYANKYFYTTYLDYKKLCERYTIWVAQWSDVNTFDGKYDMWQYTSSGRISGINGNVDMNKLYRNIFVNIGGTTNDLPDLSGYKGTSIVDGLKYSGFDSSFNARKLLYGRLGFTDEYYGTAIQNTNMLNLLRGQSSYYSSSYKGLSFVDGLKSIGVDSSFENRKRIAFNNGMTNYTGSAVQNIKLLNLLKNGKLKK